jgi:hypothetical protein
VAARISRRVRIEDFATKPPVSCDSTALSRSPQSSTYRERRVMSQLSLPHESVDCVWIMGHETGREANRRSGPTVCELA